MHLWGSPLILLLCASRRNQALGDVCNLLVDEELADQVWEAWDKGEIEDQMAWLAWLCILVNRPSSKLQATVQRAADRSQISECNALPDIL